MFISWWQDEAKKFFVALVAKKQISTYSGKRSSISCRVKQTHVYIQCRSHCILYLCDTQYTFLKDSPVWWSLLHLSSLLDLGDRSLTKTEGQSQLIIFSRSFLWCVQLSLCHHSLRFAGSTHENIAQRWFKIPVSTSKWSIRIPANLTLWHPKLTAVCRLTENFSKFCLTLSNLYLKK